MTRAAPTSVRRSVLGRDRRNNDSPHLPESPQVREILTTRCGLAPGAKVFEIVPGPGRSPRNFSAGARIRGRSSSRIRGSFGSSNVRSPAKRRTSRSFPFGGACPAPERRARSRGGPPSFHRIAPRIGRRGVARALRPDVRRNGHATDPNPGLYSRPRGSCCGRASRKMQGVRFELTNSYETRTSTWRL